MEKCVCMCTVHISSNTITTKHDEPTRNNMRTKLHTHSKTGPNYTYGVGPTSASAPFHRKASTNERTKIVPRKTSTLPSSPHGADHTNQQDHPSPGRRSEGGGGAGEGGTESPPPTPPSSAHGADHTNEKYYPAFYWKVF